MTEAAAPPVRLPPLSTERVARVVDHAVGARVLVHGSLPGRGRDIDLLARPVEEAAMRAALSAEGFTAAGRHLARFTQGSVEVVECIPAGEWDLPPAEMEALFEDAIPLPHYEHLARPSPAHVLNILARRVVEGIGRLDERRRAYIDRALDEEPGAWRLAEARAAAWSGIRTLGLLDRLYHRGRVSLRERAEVIEARLREKGRSPMRARREAIRQLAPTARRGAVVAFSGLDGSGKSTQAELLAAALERLGYPVVVEWAKLGEDRALWALARGAKGLLRPALMLRSHSQGLGLEGRAPVDAGRDLRQSSAALTYVWAGIVAVSNGWKHRRRAWWHTLSGAVVICDRYTLDSLVWIRWRYGVDREFRMASGLVRALSPSPLRAYFLDLPADLSHARKLEDSLEDLEIHARLYREELGRAGALRLDATRPPEDLAARIGLDVWQALNA